MTIIKARSVLLGLALAALTMAGTASTASAVSMRTTTELQSAATTPSIVLDGPACPDVMVIAARGSGELPSDWQNPLAYTNNPNDPNHGVGATLYLMYKELVAANPGVTFSLAPAVYRADKISVLFTNALQYLSDPQIGEESIALDIQTTDATCGHPVRYILAGYSLGAWVVHDALNELGSSKLAEIAGVALFGDPKFQPGQPFVRDFQSEDKYYGVAYNTQTQYDSIPPALVNQTGSWCLPADPVCQYRSDDLSTWSTEVRYCLRGSGACAHFQYATDGETLNAAAFLSPFLPHLYWANLDRGTIVKANLDGSSPQTIVTGQNGPVGVAVDSSHIYWADSYAGTIMEANLDGTGVTTLVSGQNSAYGVAVGSSHIYWTNVDTATVMEANLDGTGVTTLESGQNTPALMAVDSSHIYWTDEDAGTVMEANLNGTGVTTLESGQNSPSGVAVDRSHIYWADAFGGTIMEANLNGTGVTTLESGQNIPRGVAVDRSHIYWADGSIVEANLDGTGVTTLESIQNTLIGVAVGPQ